MFLDLFQVHIHELLDDAGVTPRDQAAVHVRVLKAIAVEDLESAVRNLSETRRSSLALQADKKASFGIIVKVMDALKLAGVKNLPAFTRGEK